MKIKRDGFLNKKEMAKAIGSSHSNFYSLERGGVIPSPGHQIGGRRYYTTEDIEPCRIAAAASRECDLISIREIARRLGMSRFNLDHHLHRGKAPLPTHRHLWRTGLHYTPTEADAVIDMMRQHKTKKAGRVRIEMTPAQAEQFRAMLAQQQTTTGN